jgi:hypothetical protein
MTPGQHVVLVGTEFDALQARIRGLQLRDTLLILLPGPRTSFAFLFRQPLEGTVAENVLRYGTGGLNIDATRVSIGKEDNIFQTNPHTKGGFGHAGAQIYGDSRGAPTYDFSKGRWPSNLVLVHGPGCVRIGEKKVHPGGGGTARRLAGVSNQVAYGGNIGRLAPGTPDLGYVGSDGLETVTNWQCQPDCPVRLLDEQSGESRSAVRLGGEGEYLDPSKEGWRFKRAEGGYVDSGGASRFFPQFASLAEALGWLSKLVTPC